MFSSSLWPFIGFSLVCSCLSCVREPRTGLQYCSCSLTGTGSTTFLCILSAFHQLHTRMPLATRTHCWLVLYSVYSRTPKTFSAMQPSSWLASSLYRWPRLLIPRCMKFFPCRTAWAYCQPVFLACWVPSGWQHDSLAHQTFPPVLCNQQSCSGCTQSHPTQIINKDGRQSVWELTPCDQCWLLASIWSLCHWSPPSELVNSVFNPPCSPNSYSPVSLWGTYSNLKSNSNNKIK